MTHESARRESARREFMRRESMECESVELLLRVLFARCNIIKKRDMFVKFGGIVHTLATMGRVLENRHAHCIQEQSSTICLMNLWRFIVCGPMIK